MPRRAAIGAGSECMPTERDPNFLCLARPRRRPADALLLVRPGQGRAQRSATWECESTSISVPLTTTGRPLVRRSSLSLSPAYQSPFRLHSLSHKRQCTGIGCYQRNAQITVLRVAQPFSGLVSRTRKCVGQ